MATEQEQLQLTVTLVDNASAGLQRLQEQIKGLASGENKAALERFRKNSEEAGKHLRPLSEDMAKATEKLLPFSRGIGGIATGMIGFGFAMQQGAAGLREYSNELVRLSALASQTGVSIGTAKSLLEQFAQAGVGADAAQRNIAGLAHSMADITRNFSELRQKALAGQSEKDRPWMEAFLGDLAKLANNPEAFAQKIKDGADLIFKNINEEFGPERAAEARRNWNNLWGMPDLDMIPGKIRVMSAEEKKMQEQRAAAARDFFALTTKIGQKWDAINDAMKADAVKDLKPALDNVNVLLDRISDKVGGWEGAFKPVADMISSTVTDINNLMDLFEKLGVWFGKVSDFLGKPDENVAKGWAQNPVVNAFKDTLGIKRAEQPNPMAGSPTGAAGIPGLPGSPSGPAVPRAAAPQQFASVGGGGGAYQGPAGGYDDKYSDLPASTNIEDRRDEISTEADDQLKVTKELTDQMVRLNDWLAKQGLGPGGVQMQGLANLPGMGTSPPGIGPSSPSGPAGPGSPQSPEAPSAPASPGAPSAPTSTNAAGVQGLPGSPSGPAVQRGGGDPISNAADPGSPTGAAGIQGLPGSPSGPALQRAARSVSVGAAGIQGLPGSPSGPGVPRKSAADGGGTSPLPAAGGGVIGEGGSEFLRQQRSPLVDQVEKDPQLKKRMAALLSLENEGAGPAVIESLYNRTTAINQERAKKGLPPISLKDMIHRPGRKSFYGPENQPGLVERRMAELDKDPKRRARLDKLIDQAAASNVIKGATDQGSGSDPNVYWPGGKTVIHGETFNDWGGGLGHEGNRRFREAQQAAVRAAQASPGGDRVATRAETDKSMTQQVRGTADINVNVGAQHESSRITRNRLFKKIQTTRNTQMEPAQTSQENVGPGPG